MLFEHAELERVVSKHNDRHTWYSIVNVCVVPKFHFTKQIGMSLSPRVNQVSVIISPQICFEGK